MHYRALFILGFVFLVSCLTKTPSNVLSTDKMTEIITELQLADAAYKLEMLPSTYKGHPEKYYLEILATHQTDSTIYNRSMHYYAENPNLLKKIYIAVEKNIKQKPNQENKKQ